VDHSCQQCGATVEDGRPFCSQCRAPQIRVQIAVPEAETPSEIQAVETGLAPPQPRPAASATTLDRRAAVRAALKAGVLGVFIGMIPVLGIVLTGSPAVYFYRRERGSVLTAALASRLGGAAGIVAFAINALLIVIRVFVFHAQQEYIDVMLKFVQKFGANPADPNVQASIHDLFTPSGLAFTFFFGMIFALALASIGGALASLFMRPRQPRL
jgi:hypothetical protein